MSRIKKTTKMSRLFECSLSHKNVFNSRLLVKKFLLDFSFSFFFERTSGMTIQWIFSFHHIFDIFYFRLNKNCNSSLLSDVVNFSKEKEKNQINRTKMEKKEIQFLFF